MFRNKELNGRKKGSCLEKLILKKLPTKVALSKTGNLSTANAEGMGERERVGRRGFASLFPRCKR